MLLYMFYSINVNISKNIIDNKKRGSKRKVIIFIYYNKSFLKLDRKAGNHTSAQNLYV